jgi:hypothetical protein
MALMAPISDASGGRQKARAPHRRGTSFCSSVFSFSEMKK